jgi:hypothetical protein
MFPVEASRNTTFARQRARLASAEPDPLLAVRQLRLHVLAGGANSDRGDYPLLDDDVGPAVAPLDRFARERLRFPAGKGSAAIRCFDPRIRRDVRS